MLWIDQLVLNRSVQYYAIRYIIAHVTVKHVSEDNIMFTFGSAVKGLTERHKKIYFNLLYHIPPYNGKLEWMEYIWKFLCSLVNPLTALCIYICYFQNLPFSELGVGLEGKLPWNEWAFYKNMKYTVLK